LIIALVEFALKINFAVALSERARLHWHALESGYAHPFPAIEIITLAQNSPQI
jgi:hypothetical protein